MSFNQNLTGRQLGPYLLEVLLGEGAFGRVYRARHVALDVLRAVKVMQSDIASDPRFRERFLREARMAARLHHPNIVAVHDFAAEADVQYLVMEYVESMTLADVLPRLPVTSRLTDPTIHRWMRDVAAALDDAHDAGIVHRDLKPANVLIRTSDSRALLSDFGIAQAVNQPKLTMTGRSIGTFAYMSPEQCRGSRELTSATDIYAFAAMLHEMVTGEPPFGRGVAAIGGHLDASFKLTAPGLPEGLSDVLTIGLAKDPADRYRTADDLVNAFLEAIGARAPESDRAARRSPAARPPMPEPPRGLDLTQRPDRAAAAEPPGREVPPFVPSDTDRTQHSDRTMVPGRPGPPAPRLPVEQDQTRLPDSGPSATPAAASPAPQDLDRTQPPVRGVAVPPLSQRSIADQTIHSDRTMNERVVDTSMGRSSPPVSAPAEARAPARLPLPALPLGQWIAMVPGKSRTVLGAAGAAAAVLVAVVVIVVVVHVGQTAGASQLPAPLHGTVGAPVQVAGAQTTVLSVDPVASPPASLAVPASDRFLVVNVRYGSGSNGPVIVSPYDWVVIDGTGKTYSPVVGGVSGALPQTSLSSNQSEGGSIGFVVPANAANLVLVFSPEIGYESEQIPLS